MLNDSMHRPLLSTTELSSQLGISAATISRLRRTGLPSIRIGASVRFDLGQVLAYLKESSEARHAAE